MSTRPPIKNPLIRDGISQGQRQVDALSPGKVVKVDERELADALVMAYQLSQKVNYYSEDGKDYLEDGTHKNWQPFFAATTPVQIALISKTRPQAIKKRYEEKLQEVFRDPTNDIQPVLKFWKNSLLADLCIWNRTLESQTPLRSRIRGLVQTNLKEPLLRMRGLEKRGNDLTFYHDFAQEFDFDLDAIPTYTWTLEGDASDYRTELDTIFQKLFQTYGQIIREAPNYLQASLDDRQDQPPHLALYYAFWDLLKLARDDLNQMGQKHLDFFYRKVLQLPDRPAEPDHAHLLFELAKLPGLTEFKLAAGTRFKAGKDAIGKELIYQLDTDLIVHKAKIASLKGLLMPTQDSQTRTDPKTEKPLTLISGVYESAIVNSYDGQGKDFPKTAASKAWPPFGDTSRPFPFMGLAIASDVLLLQEGTRTITVTLNLKETAPAAIQNPGSSQAAKEKIADLTNEDCRKLFQAKLSGKQWIDVNFNDPHLQHTVELKFLPNSTIQLVFTIKLTTKESPVLPYHPALPDPALPTTQPVLLLLLNRQKDEWINKLSPYQFLRTLKLESWSITAKVDQLQNLVAQNDLGILDITKPFLPFGPRPVVGSKFYIGSKEAFRKDLSRITIEITWGGLPTGKPIADFLTTYYRGYYVDAESVDGTGIIWPDYFKNISSIGLERLGESTWEICRFKPDPILSATSEVAIEIEHLPKSQEIDDLTDLGIQREGNFLRFVLNQDFLHGEFPGKYALQVLASAKDFNKGDYVDGAVYNTDKGDQRCNLNSFSAGTTKAAPISINEPYTPLIQSLRLSYETEAKGSGTLFHLYPLNGFAQLKEEPYLVPQLTYEGELFIGVQDLDPPTALPLLFQVAEDTANTEIEKATVEWFYLQNNNWLSLSDRIVSDATKGLVASGIIQFAIPEDISKTGTTILDPTYYWIKASVPERTAAICKIINVHTQVGRATFTDEGNDPNHLAKPLAAGTIAKLEVPQAAIKKVEQPYNSFDGQLKETPEHFYIRVSERLRHKGRAVTIFDYERLVLEKFPQVYKVRCINHGQLNETRDRLDELVPGAITLVVIPDLSQCSISKDLEPKVNINLLDEINQYVSHLSSAWVDIQVVNPKYEPIQIECQVKFKPAADANFGYYRRELNQTITQFLAPWITNAQVEIQFGGKLYRSAVIDLIEQQDYVDYVVNLQMHWVGEPQDLREAIASTPRSVITSGLSTDDQPFHKIQQFNETTVPDTRPPSKKNRLGYHPLKDLRLIE
jgi:hypothetical protein